MSVNWFGVRSSLAGEHKILLSFETAGTERLPKAGPLQKLLSTTAVSPFIPEQIVLTTGPPQELS